MRDNLRRLLACVACYLVGSLLCLSGTLVDAAEQPKYRRPVDLVVDPTNEHLLVACSGTGELEIYDTRTNSKLRTLQLAESIDSLTLLDRNFVAACSSKSHQTFILSWTGDTLQCVAEISNSHSPVRVYWDSVRKQLFVACLWSRRIDSIQLGTYIDRWMKNSEETATAPEKLHPDQVWDVAIAPRMMTSLGDRGLAVSDSFGRELLVIDPSNGRTVVQHDFFGTSIRGLDAHNNQLIALHSMLNEFAKTDENEIHWGVLLANDVRILNIEQLMSERGDRIYVGGRVNPIGIPGNGAAEPTSMSIHTDSNAVAVSVGGTDQVAIGSIDGFTYKYINVGRYPTAVAWSRDGRNLYVANQYDDSVSVIDVNSAKVVSEILQGPVRKLADAELGEQLFHSATLSHDRWLTCASCHVDGHTNGQLSDNFGDRSYGAPKRVPSLFGIKGTQPFTWLGHEAKLQGQIVASIRKTMHSYRKLDGDEVEHIAAYMESLPAVVSLSVARKNTNEEQVARGRIVFEAKGCAECHNAPTYTSQDVYDVGVADEKKQRNFNPPSLRGVSQRGPELFHDNRANGLRGVLVDQRHAWKEPMNESELADLIAFLHSL